MASTDPLLSTLCKICHTNAPKYTCPRCALQTCSLPCTKRHKLWSSCSGIRDPTVYVPRSQLATPSGIDHDYNFIAGIERNLSRVEREIIDEKGLIEARAKREKREWLKKGDANVSNAIRRTEVIVDRAPKGMSRQKSNGTSWNRGSKALNWQVEWVSCLLDVLGGRSKVLEFRPLAGGFDDFLEEERIRGLSAAEKKAEKKRKGGDGEQVGKKRRVEDEDADGDEADVALLAEQLCLQDPQTSAWNMDPAPILSAPPKPSPYDFYLLKPHTPIKMPKVLIPMDGARPLMELLRGQVVLEYPTIYVFLKGEKIEGKGFLTEAAYLSSRPKSKEQGRLVGYESSEEEEEEGEEEEESETSSSGSSSEDSESESDQEMEE